MAIGRWLQLVMEWSCSHGIAYRRVISEIVTLLSPSEALGSSVTHTTIEPVSVGVNSKVVVPWVKAPSASSRAG